MKEIKFVAKHMGIMDVTANDFKEHRYFKYYPEKLVKFLWFKTIYPAHISDDFNYYLIEDIPNDLKIIDGIVYIKPHAWINYFNSAPNCISFETYHEAIDYAEKLAKKHELYSALGVLEQN